MKLNRVLLIFTFLIIFPLSGCLPKATTVTVPAHDVTIDEATEINLKILDLTKMTTNETDEVLGFPLEDVEDAKVVEYRYPVEPIKVKVIKFTSEEATNQFWVNWSHYISKGLKIDIDLNRENEKGYWEFTTRDFKVLTWKQGLWLTYIEVPNELKNSEDLSYKVKDLIMHHFDKLQQDTRI